MKARSFNLVENKKDDFKMCLTKQVFNDFEEIVVSKSALFGIFWSPKNRSEPWPLRFIFNDRATIDDRYMQFEVPGYYEAQMEFGSVNGKHIGRDGRNLMRVECYTEYNMFSIVSQSDKYIHFDRDGIYERSSL